MEIISFEKRTFEEIAAKLDRFVQRVESLCREHGGKETSEWMDNQDVCRYLNILPRTVITVPCLFLKSITRYSTSRKMCRVSSRKLRTEGKRHFTEDVTYNS